MARYFSFLLIIFGFTGIYSISTISKVSMKAGCSITVPCSYENKYTSNVKYLCKGKYWHSCSYAVKTNRPDHSGKFAISDDKVKRIFTVTINHLTYEDTDHYWCAVEIDNAGDDSLLFYLSVQGDPALSVDHQEITGFIGDSMTLQCQSRSPGEIKWCRLDKICGTDLSKSIDGTDVDSHASHKGLTVTMSRLTAESSGWYYCVNGDLQMPVHLTVTEKPSTIIAQSSPITHPTDASGEQTVITFKPEQQRKGTLDLKSLIIPLSLLFFVVMMTLFIWLILKKHKQRKVKSSATVMAEEEVTYSDVRHKSKTSVKPWSEVIYCNAGNVSGTTDQMSHTDVDVTYSSVVIKK